MQPCFSGRGFVPVGVDDLAERQLAAHLQVALVLGQIAARAATGIHLTVLVRLIQSFDELTWKHTQHHLIQAECLFRGTTSINTLYLKSLTSLVQIYCCVMNKVFAVSWDFTASHIIRF